MNRFVTYLVALAFAATTLLVGAGSAPANAGASGEARPAAAVKHRTVTLKFTAKGSTFELSGKVSPRGARKPVVLQVRTCKSCHWKNFRHTRTTSRGAFAFKGLARVGHFRARVKKSNGFATSTSHVVGVVKH